MLSNEDKSRVMDLQLEIYNCKIKTKRLLANVDNSESLILRNVLERLENCLIDLDVKLGDQNEPSRPSVSS